MAQEWTFYYEENGRRVNGFASLSEPFQKGGEEDWWVTVKCDRDKDRDICGVDGKQAVHLGKELLPAHYHRFQLKNEDGSPFSWG